MEVAKPEVPGTVDKRIQSLRGHVRLGHQLLTVIIFPPQHVGPVGASRHIRWPTRSCFTSSRPLLALIYMQVVLLYVQWKPCPPNPPPRIETGQDYTAIVMSSEIARH